MTTRLDLMNRVRAELGDTVGPQYVWPDTLLQQYVVEAVREWGLVRPVRRQEFLVGTAGQRDFGLGAELIPNGVVSVEWPQGILVPGGMTAVQTPRWSWDVGASSSQIWFYDQAYELVEDGSNRFVRFRYPVPAEAQGQSVIVTYLGYYAAPQQDGDTLEVAVEDETALLWFVCGRAYRWLDEQRAKRGVWGSSGQGGSGGSGNVKNMGAATDYEQRYAAYAASRWRARGVRSGLLTTER